MESTTDFLGDFFSDEPKVNLDSLMLDEIRYNQGWHFGYARYNLRLYQVMECKAIWSSEDAVGPCVKLEEFLFDAYHYKIVPYLGWDAVDFTHGDTTKVFELQTKLHEWVWEHCPDPNPKEVYSVVTYPYIPDYVEKRQKLKPEQGLELELEL